MAVPNTWSILHKLPTYYHISPSLLHLYFLNIRIVHEPASKSSQTLSSHLNLRSCVNIYLLQCPRRNAVAIDYITILKEVEKCPYWKWNENSSLATKTRLSPRRPYSIYLVRLFRTGYLHVMVIYWKYSMFHEHIATRRWLELLHGTPTGLLTIISETCSWQELFEITAFNSVPIT